MNLLEISTTWQGLYCVGCMKINMFPKDNMELFLQWQENTERYITNLERKKGIKIPGKQIKKIMINGYRKIMHPNFIKNYIGVDFGARNDALCITKISASGEPIKIIRDIDVYELALVIRENLPEGLKDVCTVDEK